MNADVDGSEDPFTSPRASALLNLAVGYLGEAEALRLTAGDDAAALLHLNLAATKVVYRALNILQAVEESQDV